MEAEEVEYHSLPKSEAAEWAYTMRRTMQEIVPGLFLGPYSAASKNQLDSLKKSEITHIVCVRQECESRIIRPNFPEHFKYLIMTMEDSITESIIRFLSVVKKFLDECLDGGGKALVHGNAGISRSAALVIGYVMERFGMTFGEARLYVQQRRFCINPNEGFLSQLSEYEPIYKAQRTIVASPTKEVQVRLKRNCEWVENEEDSPCYYEADDKRKILDSGVVCDTPDAEHGEAMDAI